MCHYLDKDKDKDKDGAKRCHPAIRTKPTAVYKYVNYYNTQKSKNKRYTLPIEQDQKLKNRLQNRFVDNSNRDVEFGKLNFFNKFFLTTASKST